MKLSRRSFLSNASLALGSAAAAPLVAAESSSSTSTQKKGKPKLAISTYSYWHFKSERVPIEHVIREAGRLGAPAVDILHR